MTSSPFSNATRIELPDDAACPCGTGRTYGSCCGPYLAVRETIPTAEACMRSRYTAYVLRNADHLFRTWHPRTRPDSIVLDDIEWTNLEIGRTSGGGRTDQTGQVEFTAHWRMPDGTEADLHEVSEFTRRQGRWVYLEGDHHFHLDNA